MWAKGLLITHPSIKEAWDVAWWKKLQFLGWVFRQVRNAQNAEAASLFLKSKTKKKKQLFPYIGLTYGKLSGWCLNFELHTKFEI
jgi:hypothetical protein